MPSKAIGVIKEDALLGRIYIRDTYNWHIAATSTLPTLDGWGSYWMANSPECFQEVDITKEKWVLPHLLKKVKNYLVELNK